MTDGSIGGWTGRSCGVQPTDVRKGNVGENLIHRSAVQKIWGIENLVTTLGSTHK
jgi:hypothetical protein